MEILYYDTLESTQLWLIEQIKTHSLSAPICVVAKNQTNGIGSRANTWHTQREALTFSFALPLQQLPNDLPLHSSSLYFGYILKEILTNRGSLAWLKWPNDLYLDTHKIGGILTQKVQNTLICGIGINLKTNGDFAALEEHVHKEDIIEEMVKKNFSIYQWKQIFSKYRLEFHLNYSYSFHKGNEKIPIKEAILQEDGALLYRGEKLYNAR
ncbi:biotin--[acetyl-CoA-carboxylase] ligase [Helicobacter monodelphidis]|uniref:biotin--[acetyl-CoA-carboxylase] ligase n=1 Tax=Helicobacter sp. 15-1451 TaxID=2004995 RepID=UPI000DCAFF5B|nr:biotin--[acetyl-CoA-carboxylase] ligase [Helicobacter sp. 15-1451]RAX56935.1 biotin--[acetyl-CoA-carboxylase] ligase [Helicobacter sp. 15-1451]